MEHTHGIQTRICSFTTLNLYKMELTKKDKKHIENEVTKLMFRFNVECTEYARLYERTYLEELQKKIGEKIEFLDLYAHQQRIASENKESK